MRCPSFVNCSGSRFEHIHVQQQLVSSTASPADDVHVLLKLISVAATHTRDEGKKCLVSAAFEPQCTFTLAADQVVEHTSDARNLVIAEGVAEWSVRGHFFMLYRDSLFVFTGHMLPSGTRHLALAVRKSSMCDCGCGCWCTLFPLYRFVLWSLYVAGVSQKPRRRDTMGLHGSPATTNAKH